LLSNWFGFGFTTLNQKLLLSVTVLVLHEVISTESRLNVSAVKYLHHEGVIFKNSFEI